MTAPRFAVIDAPHGASPVFDIARATLRRTAANLPLWLALTVLVVVSSTLAILTRNGLDVRTFVASEPFRCLLLSDTLFVVCIMLAVVVADEVVARGAGRTASYACALVAGCATGAWAQAHAISALGWTAIPGIPADMVATRPLQLFFYAMVYATFGCFVYVNHRTARLAEQRMRDAELARANSRRRTLESQLQAMQARVEPQFLFNTLAHVCDLYESDEAAASRMLDDLIAYLRAALPHLRESRSTLGREVELVRAWLDIVRGGLQADSPLEIVLPSALASRPMPAMTLLPLIDHAVGQRRHASAWQGPMRIECTAHGGRLRIEFTHVPGGMGAEPGSSGTAPHALAERLRALYGEEARLDVVHAPEGGVHAILEIPPDNGAARQR